MNTIVRESFLKDPQVLLWLIDTERCKDQLFAFVHDPDGTRWEVHREAGDDYAKEMASEHKVFDRSAKREVWVKTSNTAANHYWDCEVAQVAAAFRLGLGMPHPHVIPQPQQASAQDRPAWIPPRPKRWI